MMDPTVEAMVWTLVIVCLILTFMEKGRRS